MENSQKPEQFPYPQPPGYSPNQQTFGGPSYTQPPFAPAYNNQSPGYPPYPQSGYQPSTGIKQNTIHNNVQAPVVVVQPTLSQPVYLSNKPYLNFTGAIIFSCVTYWCFGCLFGLIAFILAMVGQSSAANGDEASAKSMLIGSYVLSSIGVVIGIIAIIVLAVLFLRPSSSYRSCLNDNCHHYTYY